MSEAKIKSLLSFPHSKNHHPSACTKYLKLSGGRKCYRHGAFTWELEIKRENSTYRNKKSKYGWQWDIDRTLTDRKDKHFSKSSLSFSAWGSAQGVPLLLEWDPLGVLEEVPAFWCFQITAWQETVYYFEKIPYLINICWSTVCQSGF